MDVLKNEALTNPDIISLSGASSVPDQNLTTVDFGLKDNSESVNKYLELTADEDYFNTLGIKFVARKNFSENIDLREKEIIINETLAHKLGFNNASDAIGQLVTMTDCYISGVVKDYNHLSLHEEIIPMVFRYGLDRLSYFMIRVRPSNMNTNLVFLKTIWETTFINNPFYYSFISDYYDFQYDNESRLLEVSFLFTVISILITVMGIIATSLNLTKMRIKEIGIRNVNGARVPEILSMLNKDYVKWIVIAFIIAMPISYYAIHKWLENFAYKVNFNWWIFVLAGMLTLGITVLTGSFQSGRLQPKIQLRHSGMSDEIPSVMSGRKREK